MAEDGFLGRLRKARGVNRPKGPDELRSEREPDPKAADPGAIEAALRTIARALPGRSSELWKDPCFWSCPHYTARRIHRYDSGGTTIAHEGGVV